MRRRITCWACAAVGLWAAAAGAQIVERDRYLFVDELKLPAQGVMRTVVQGTKIDELKVEVLSVMKNFDPKRDVILARITDPKGKEAGIVGGMSGSPIYVDGKILGALAYGWQFQKDAYIGIQPIEQMLRLHGAPQTTRRLGMRPGRLPTRDGEEICCRALYRLADADGPAPAADTPEEAATQLRPLANPLTVSGASRRTFRLIQRLFAGTDLVPLQGGAAPAGVVADPPRLEPGAAVAVAMITGDLDMSMVGTCTDVIGNQVLAFGHDIFGEGATELPMASGYVHATVPSVMRSFKLGSPVKVVGSFVQDEYSGSLGQLGGTPRTIPVEINLTDAGGRTTPFHFQIAHTVNYTPRLLRTVISAALTGQQDLPRLSILRYRGEVFFQGLGSIRYDNSIVADEWDLMRDIVAPVELMMDNRFGEAKVTELKLDVTVVEKPLAARILDLRPPDRKFRPGETVEVGVLLRPYRKDDLLETVSLTLPADLPDGTYRCMVGSASKEVGLLTSLEPYRFKPQSMAELVKALQIDAKRERLYMRLVLDTGGLAVEGLPLADLPPSRARLLTSAGLPELYPYRRSIGVDKQVPFLVTGGAGFEITVDKNAPR